MDLPWFLLLPLVWLVARLFLVVAIGLGAPKLDEFSRSPFGPSGAIAGTDLGCMLALISGVFGGLASAASLTLLAKPPEMPTIIIIGAPVAVLGFLLSGAGFDLWLCSKAQEAISRWVIIERLPEVRGWLRDGSDQDKLRAAILMGHMREKMVALDHLPDLIAALDSKNSDVRYFIASAIMSIVHNTNTGPQGMADRVVPLLQDPDPRVRAPIARALVEARILPLPQVVRPLASALMSDDTTAWSLVTYYLDAPGRYTHLAFDEIWEAVAHHGAKACEALKLPFRWIAPEGESDLKAALSHPNLHVRNLASHGIARLGSVPTKF